MSKLKITKTYQDGVTPTQTDIDNIVDSIETFINVTKLSGENIQDNSINALQVFAPESITAGKLANFSITTDKIADGAVTAGKLQEGAITTAKIADGAVTTSKIADGAVTLDKLGMAVEKIGEAKKVPGSFGAGVFNLTAFDTSSAAPNPVEAFDDDLITVNLKRPAIIVPSGSLTASGTGGLLGVGYFGLFIDGSKASYTSSQIIVSNSDNKGVRTAILPASTLMYITNVASSTKTSAIGLFCQDFHNSSDSPQQPGMLDGTIRATEII